MAPFGDVSEDVMKSKRIGKQCAAGGWRRAGEAGVAIEKMWGRSGDGFGGDGAAGGPFPFGFEWQSVAIGSGDELPC